MTGPPKIEVDVAILHPEAGGDAGTLTRAVAAARLRAAEQGARDFLAAGATRARIVSGRPDARTFGERLRAIARTLGEGGLVVLGSGAIPLATTRDRRELVAAAEDGSVRALTNNWYSGDVVAVARARSVLADVPDLPSDNALPRWLTEVAGIRVEDRRGRWRLGVDIDGPLDLMLLGNGWPAGLADDDIAAVGARLAAVRSVSHDARAELVISGRVSAANLAWLEAHTASRTRAIIEERGLRTRRADQRSAASLLAMLLERDGPGSLGDHLARIGEAAVIDTRVLLAHRFGAEPAGWPIAEDRYASDLLLATRIADPWLRDLTSSAVRAAIPILLGGHTLVGPGLRLALGGRAGRTASIDR